MDKLAIQDIKLQDWPASSSPDQGHESGTGCRKHPKIGGRMLPIQDRYQSSVNAVLSEYIQTELFGCSCAGTRLMLRISCFGDAWTGDP